MARERIRRFLSPNEEEQVGSAVLSGIERKLKQGALYLYVGNGVRAQVEAIGSFDLVLPNGLVICLDNCHYAPTITRGVVSVSRLVDNGFVQCFTDCGISVSKNGVLYFNAVPRNVKHNLDSTYLWHCRLAHINKKRIKQLQQDGLLKSTDDESFDKCESCLSGKMTKKPFPHSNERAKDLLGIIHTDIFENLTKLYLYPFEDYALAFCNTHSSIWCQLRRLTKTIINCSMESSKLGLLKGYPKNDGLLFYFPPENKIVVARYVEFFEKRLISQEISGRAVDLEEIQEEEDTTPSEITSNIPQEVEEVEEHSLGDLNEPASYKAAMLDSESNKWIDAMNAEIQSMMDNMESMQASKIHFMVLSKIKKLDKRFDEESKWFGFTQNLDEPLIILESVLLKNLGKLHFILESIFYRDRSKRLIGLCQNAYMDKILKRYKMDNSKRGHIPMQERLDLNKSQGAQTPNEVNRMKNVPYASAVGSIMYAVRCTRPDVAFAQNMTSRFQQNPGEPHWTAVKNILKYLRNTKDMFLVYGRNPSTELRVECYCDAGFETGRDDTKSQTGYVFVLNGGAVDWKSSKQSTTAMSATESEYIAASEAAMEAVWIRKFISGLGIVPTINEPLNMYCDNSAAVHYANEPGVQKGARHYQRRYHYVRECVELGEIRILKVHTDNNLADPFTKALSNRKLTQHARGMGLRPASSFM
ncbi:retrotransposon protein, putative, ty1-copia subclass [Tanacetum coccineum]